MTLGKWEFTATSGGTEQDGSFDSKVSMLMNHFVDMAVQGYGWIGVA